MPLLVSFILFLFLYLLSPYWDELNSRNNNKILIILFVICVFTIGVRNPAYWIDTAAYVFSFWESENLTSFTLHDDISAYSEKGYYLICVIIKTFTNSSLIYLTVIGLLSMSFLFKSLRRYCLLPVLGLSIYIARYMLSRDMNQMRGGLAISMLMAFTYLLSTIKIKDEFKYVVVCWLISFIHTSILAAIPIVLLNHVKITKKWICFGIIASFLVSASFSQQIIDFISQSDTIKEMARDYVDKEGENIKAYAADLSNPMIYYQCVILFIYTFMEKKLVPMSKYYYVFRNGFFMSTVILIILCQYAILAGRVSTIFATFEIFMIPMIIKGLPKSYRSFAYLVLLAPLTMFFFKNYA